MIIIPTIHVTFNPEKPLTVPVNYQHLLQSFVYRLLPENKATAIHDQGFLHHKRVYKPLCFSKLIGPTEYDKNTRKLTFNRKIRLSISSIIPEVVETALNNLMLAENLTLHGQRIYVDNIQFDRNKITEDRLMVKAVSPIVVYSTFEKRNGSKITHYFSPQDLVFEHLIQENFARKYEAFTGKSLDAEPELLQIKPLQASHKDKVITNYKDTWIVGYTGVYELKAKPEYLSFMLDCGLGSKNAAGFGMVIPVKEEEDNRT